MPPPNNAFVEFKNNTIRFHGTGAQTETDGGDKRLEQSKTLRPLSVLKMAFCGVSFDTKFDLRLF